MSYPFISNLSAFKMYRISQSQSLNVEKVNHKICPSSEMRFSQQMILDANIDPCILNRGKLDVLVASPNSIYKSRNFRFHCYQGVYPPGSFYKIDNRLYVSSPELLFCQMANELTIEKLLLLGYEICGSYALDFNRESGFVNNVPALTSAAEIDKYIQRLKKHSQNFRGLKKATRAVKYIKDGSASPKESRLAIILCAPRNLGGFGVKNCVLNEPVKLSKSARIICGQEFVKPDISIPKNKIAIEYDSDYFHNNDEQNRRDKKRIDALQHDG